MSARPDVAAEVGLSGMRRVGYASARLDFVAEGVLADPCGPAK